jgi:hypothetical protein
MSIYDKLIDSLSGYAVPYEDHPQLSTRDFEYDHPLTGIENNPIVNIDNLSFNINTIEDLSLDEIVKIYDELVIASALTLIREYDEDDRTELFTYYKGRKNQYNDKKIPRTSAIYLRNLKNHVNSVVYKIKAKQKEERATELLPTLEKFLEIHKKVTLKCTPIG